MTIVSPYMTIVSSYMTKGSLKKLENRNKSRDRKREKNAGRLDETKLTGNRETVNTGINTQGIMGKMGDTWREVEIITKTGETDHGVTVWEQVMEYAGWK